MLALQFNHISGCEIVFVKPDFILISHVNTKKISSSCNEPTVKWCRQILVIVGCNTTQHLYNMRTIEGYGLCTNVLDKSKSA